MKHFFTSVNNAYIPKAAVLVESLRRVYGSEACVWCMLSDSKREDIDYSIFDRTLTVEDLDLPVASLEAWIFSHTVVELCTAVKPFAFKKIFRDTGADNAIYMDPDTVLYTPMDEVYALLPERPVMLTPHVTVPAIDIDDLLDGEMLGCLRHGVFNLGFLALATTATVALSSTGGPRAVSTGATTMGRAACSPISDGSIWRRASSTRSRSCAIPATTLPPGTCTTARSARTPTAASPSTAPIRCVFSISRASTSAPTRRCCASTLRATRPCAR